MARKSIFISSLVDALRDGQVIGEHVDLVALPLDAAGRWLVMKNPAMLSMGPVGPCSPGIHFGIDDGQRARR